MLIATAGELLARECLPLRVRNPEGNYIIPGAKGDIVYRQVNGVALSLDAFVQKQGNKRPAVIVIHGGSWETGSRVAFVGQFLEMLTAAGYNWFSIDYRKSGINRAAESVEDLRAAIEFIRCHAKEFRIDPNNIALLGEDTGAQMALMAAAEKPAGVKAVVSIGGVYSNPQLSTPNSQLPTLVIHGTSDREVPPQQAEQFCRSGNCELVLVEDAIHRAENWWPSQWSYKQKLVDWLAKHL